MKSPTEDTNRNIALFINELPQKYLVALPKLSKKLGRPLSVVLLIDTIQYAKRKNSLDNQNQYKVAVVNFNDDTELQEAVKPFQNNLLLVACPLEKSQLYFKRIIPHIPYVNTPTEYSIDLSTDKGKMRQALLDYDISISPKAITVYDASPKTIVTVCTSFKFPVITKPTNLASSRLVSNVENEEELHSVLTKSFKTLDKIYSKYRNYGDATMVVEEFVEGKLYSTDVYINAQGKVYVLPFNRFFNGTAAGAKSFQVYQGETFHTLSKEEERLGRIVVRKAIHAVGLRSSVAHIELFHQGNSWKIIELGARPGGWRQEMYQLSYGIDHAFNELLIKVGLEPEMPSSIDTYVTTFSVHAPKAGMLESITGLEEVRAHPNLYKLLVKPSIGEKVEPSTEGGSPIIDGLMYHEDVDQLNQLIQYARSAIKVTVK